MSEVMKQSEVNDEPLSWLAFRYISDEMSDAEVVEFESRLNTDSPTFEVAACEAVAHAVQLNDAVAEASEPVSGPAPQSTFEATGRRDVVARRVSLFAASITVLAVGWALTLPSPKPRAEVVDSPAPQPLGTSSGMSGELVQIWADSGNELLSVVEEIQMPPADDLPEYFSADVPDWLLAAVQSRDASSVDPEVLEN
jgi:hypothetical protein